MRAAIALFVALLALAPSALASDRFTDPRGDAGGNGPDITAVTLSHTDAVLTIAVDFASAPPLGYDKREQYTDVLLIGIHTDANLSQNDVEFWTGVHGVDLAHAIVVRGAPTRGIVGTADVAVAGTTVTIKIQRALLGDPSEVAVMVAAGRESVNEQAGGGGDMAPASGAFSYQLATGGTPSWLWPVVGSGAAVVLALAAFAVLSARRSARGHRLGVAD